MPTDPPLYDPRFEHDACGVGFVADAGGRAHDRVLSLALSGLAALGPRGAFGADGTTPDGAGILLPLEPVVLARLAGPRAARRDRGRLGVVCLFLPRGRRTRRRAAALAEAALLVEGLVAFRWRRVPMDPRVLGPQALASRPHVCQLIVRPPAGVGAGPFEVALVRARRRMEATARSEGLTGFAVASASCRTVVYKGLVAGGQLAALYPDLAPPLAVSHAVFHQRYATNTMPSWGLAQPFRFLAHNGEINTLQGNRNWMRAREAELTSPVWGDAFESLRPIIWEEGSDSASLDNALELLEESGRDVLHAMMMLVPPAWENMAEMEPRLRDFYRYHDAVVEPWDGPAGLAFTDGFTVGAVLDRNGLRPSRYKIDQDGLVVAASEVGVVDMDDATIVEKGRLGPGQMLAVDTVGHRILRNDDLKREIAFVGQRKNEPLRQHAA